MSEAKAPQSLDTDRRKGSAAHDIEQGAVTEGYPLDLKNACRLLNQALATEMVCVLRYRHHQITAKGIHAPQVVDEFAEHAENEEKHALMLAKRIDQLGGDPDFDPSSFKERSATEYGSATELVDMIREDLIAERVVIDWYREQIQWFGTKDPTTRRILEKILADEEDHANDLADLLTAHGGALSAHRIGQDLQEQQAAS
jgi:bacterioferritin